MKIPFKKAPLSDKIFIVIDYVVMTLIMFIIAIPVLHILAASFSSSQAVVTGKVFIFPVDFTLTGYNAVLENPKIVSGFLNSVFYTFVGTAVCIAMTLCCAYPLTRKEFKARGVVTYIFIFTMYFGGGLIPWYLVVDSLGLINNRLGMIIPSAMSVWNMIICKSFIQHSIPDELYEAAQIDGCSPFKYMLRVIVPLCTPIIAVLTLYYGVGKWNDYFTAMVLLRDQSLLPLQNILRDILLLGNVDMTQVTNADALADLIGLKELLKYSTIVVASLPMMVLYPFVQKYFIKGMMIGAIKG